MLSKKPNPNIGFEEDIKNVLSALKDRYGSTRLIGPFFSLN